MKAQASGRLSPREKTLMAVEVAGSYRRVKGLMRHNALPAALAELRAGAPPDEREPVSLPDALRLGRAVARTLAVLPIDSRCLMQSLVLTSMLARRGTPGTL